MIRIAGVGMRYYKDSMRIIKQMSYVKIKHAPTEKYPRRLALTVGDKEVGVVGVNFMSEPDDMSGDELLKLMYNMIEKKSLVR